MALEAWTVKFENVMASLLDALINDSPLFLGDNNRVAQ
jgi:hypothetical protein